MTTKTFENFTALTTDLAYDLIDRIKAADLAVTEIDTRFGLSSQSCSAYAEINCCFGEDEDGYEVWEEFKVRFSDHADSNGSDITFRIDDKIETIKDKDGAYLETTIEDSDYSALLDAAMTEIEAFIAKHSEAA